MLLTKKQRTALKAVFDRCPLWIVGEFDSPRGPGHSLVFRHEGTRVTYRQFRRMVRRGSGCIMVPWCNMWLGIEPDGYTHS